MALDSNNRLMLFGGANGFSSSGTLFDETWEWTGSQWLQLHPATSPPARTSAMMAFDPVSRKTILFGGNPQTGTALNDTWQFDGSNWTQLHPAISPPGRWGAGMAPDSHPSLVLFGGWAQGAPGTPNILGDTWRWDGSNWTQLTPANPPSLRTDFGFTYDPVRGKDVMFAGRVSYIPPGASTPIINETWEWDGAASTWTQRAPASSPPATQLGSLVFDGKAITLIGGGAPVSASSQDWQWDGTNWTERVLGTPPAPRTMSATGWDSASQRAILFGGFQDGYVPLGDTYKGLYYTVQADANLSSIAASPVTVPPDGSSKAQVSVVIRDSRGNPIAGVSVRVTASGPGPATVQPSSATTDRFGSAAFTATNSSPGQATFTGADLTDGITLSHTTTVNFSSSAVVDWKQAAYIAPYPTVGDNVAFDSTRDVVVLFGPRNPSGPGGALAETWELADGHWTQKHPTTSPPASGNQFGGPTLAYDPTRKQTILFDTAGDTCSTNCGPGQTWAWNGASWTQLHPAHSPASRAGAAMSWDPTHQKIVFFGGEQHCQGSACGGVYQFYFGDTWTWDGTDWTEFPFGPSPTPRVGASMAPDSAGHVVLFGGSDSQGAVMRETWTWDGSAWTQQAPASSPSGRFFVGLALNTATNKTMLFGGRACSASCNGYADRVADLWQWDGTALTWTQLHPGGTNPPLAQATILAYDSGRSRLLLLPDETPIRDGPIDLWEYNGTTWTNRRPSWPTDRFRAQMVFDTVRNISVMVGGANSYGSGSSEVWEWDGAAWHQRHPSKPPSLRLGASMAFDGGRGKTLLFGGTESSVTCTVGCPTTTSLKSDTWTWDGTTWIKLQPSVAPSPRTGAQMTFDPVRNVVLLFGGQTGLSPVTASSETWQWDGTSWTLLHPSTVPPARSGNILTFDQATGMALLFGGRDAAGNMLGDTYEWNGTNWLLRHPALSPSPRADSTSAYDAATHRVFMFGGQDTPNHPFSEGWAWDGANWTLTDPVSRPLERGQAAMTYDGPHDQLVLFGGNAYGTALDDTWLGRPSP
jgi:hypothetical protein